MLARRFDDAVSLSERVYTHPDIRALVDAINMI